MDPDNTTKILLIESDERLGELTARYLGSHGFAVVIQRDGRSARGLGGYACIVVGLLRTGRDGGDAAQELATCSDVPIVASWTLEPGETTPQPIVPRELLRRIRQAIGTLGVPDIPRVRSDGST